MSRRLKIATLLASDVLEMLAMDSSEFINRLSLPLPKGYCVLGVHENWSLRSFDVLIEHPSFPEVPDGESPPSMGLLRGVAQVVALIRNGKRRCPRCGSTDLSETALGAIGRNPNRALCGCGWKGESSETYYDLPVYCEANNVKT
jgi:hypothetical protein